MPPSDTEHSRWFLHEVQPHEPALRAYLHSRFPLLRDADDIVQETYRRLLREKDLGRIRHARAFMFTAARNVALDFFRRRESARTDAIPNTSLENVVEQGPDAAEMFSRQEELDHLAAAVENLPHRCRQVMMLRYTRGCSYKEIATILNISPETVKTHMAKGVLLCTQHFEAHGMSKPREPDANAQA